MALCGDLACGAFAGIVQLQTPSARQHCVEPELLLLVSFAADSLREQLAHACYPSSADAGSAQLQSPLLQLHCIQPAWMCCSCEADLPRQLHACSSMHPSCSTRMTSSFACLQEEPDRPAGGRAGSKSRDPPKQLQRLHSLEVSCGCTCKQAQVLLDANVRDVAHTKATLGLVLEQALA